jgi:Glycosyltransferase family 87
MNRPGPERVRQLAWLALALYIVGLGISATLRIQGDFAVYYRSGHRILHGIAVYGAEDRDRFLYAPIVAIAFVPFALLPRHVAQAAFFILNAWGLAALIVGSGVMLFGRERRLSALLLAGPLILTFRFIGNNIEHGQVNLIVLALCVWAIVYARESRTRMSGAMLAVAALIKPFAIFAGLYLLLRGKFSALGWAIAAGAVLLLAPIVVFGAHGWVDQNAAYLRAVGSMTGRYRTMLTNQSAVACFSRFAGGAAAEGRGPLWMGMSLEAALAAIEVCWLLASARSGGDRIQVDRLAVAGLFCLMPAFAPISWKSYYAALLVPYMALLAGLWEDRRTAATRPAAAWALFVVSVPLNLAPGKRLNRIALFYSAHFLSSLFALGAVWALGIHDSRAARRAAKLDGPARETGS